MDERDSSGINYVKQAKKGVKKSAADGEVPLLANLHCMGSCIACKFLHTEVTFITR